MAERGRGQSREQPPPADTLRTERTLVALWERQRFDRSALVDSAGRPLTVVFRGWPNRGPGPDFRQAILADGAGNLIRGDVELHVAAGDWSAHGHHRDPGYDEVVLHVVLGPAGAGPITLASGRTAPTVVLRGPVLPPDGPDELPDDCRDAAGEWDAGALLGVLDRAGDRRLRIKADRFEAELAARDAAEVLYTGLLEALGYAANVRPFRTVAERAPLAVLEGFAAGKGEAAAVRIVEAVLLRAGGFLRPVLPGTTEAAAYLTDLLTAAGPDRLAGLAADPPGWTGRGVRPENAPARRLAGAARLIARCRERGLLATVAEALRRPGSDDALKRLEGLITVPPDGFWADHASFDRRIPPGALIGADRARTLIADIVLPYVIALGPAIDEPDLADRAWAVFRAMPRLPENTITRRLIDQIDPAGALRRSLTARRLQGLLHLWRTSCEQRLCERCPIAAARGDRGG